MPDQVELTTGLTFLSGSNTVERCESVQEIDNYLATSTIERRSPVHLPEPRQALALGGDGERDAHGMKDEMRPLPVVAPFHTAMNRNAAAGPDLSRAFHPHTTCTLPTDIPHRLSRLEAKRDSEISRVPRNESSSNMDATASKMKPNGSEERMSKVDVSNDANGNRSSIPSPNSANPAFGQNRLLYLTEVINRNISPQAAADDGRGIKAANAALELAAAVRPPTDIIMEWFATVSVISAVRLFMHWKAFDAIPSGGGESISYADLAERVNADEGLVGKAKSCFCSHAETTN
jgi:hypothetical protein